MLHSYELGLLSEELAEQVEIHLLDCPACFQKIQQLKDAASLIRSDETVKSLINEIDSEAD